MNAVTGGTARTWPTVGDSRAPALRRHATLIVAAAAVVAAIGAGWLTLAAAHSTYPAALALFRVYLLLANVGIGLLWWRKRPGNQVGTILVAGGFLWAATALQGAALPAAYTAGVLAEGLAAFATFYAAVVFPIGRPVSLVERALVAMYGLVVGVLLPLGILVTPEFSGGSGPLNTCALPCPPNAFFVGEAPALRALLAGLGIVSILGAAIGVSALAVARLRRASQARVRAIAPVALATLIFYPIFVVYHAGRIVLPLPASAQEDLAWLSIAARLIFPLGFLLALIQADLWAGAARLRLLNELLRRPSAERWQAAVAESLNDPGAQIGYFDASRNEYLDASGATMGTPAGTRERLQVDVERNGAVVARIATDPALVHEPELLSAAADATLVAVEQGHLASAMQRLQKRVEEVGDEERRRIQRDLHDSAQQRLIALRVHVALEGERVEIDERERDFLDRVGHELDETLDELRLVARGGYPVALERDGVGPALRQMADHVVRRISVDDTAASRHDPEVELAAYYCCMEAMQNALKHAGDEATISITLADRSGALFFQIDDDGRGFEHSAADGAGLANMEERVAQLGGHITIGLRPGGGTRVAGVLPD